MYRYVGFCTKFNQLFERCQQKQYSIRPPEFLWHISLGFFDILIADFESDSLANRSHSVSLHATYATARLSRHVMHSKTY